MNIQAIAFTGAGAMPHRGLNVAGLISVQPADSSYVGGPYLNRGMGGVGPGFSVAIDRVHDRLALAGELSAAWIPVDQSGRLVPGGHYEGSLNDWMLSALVGYQRATRPTSERIVVGMSAVAGLVGVPLSFAVGFDIFDDQDARVGLFVTGRLYAPIDRGMAGRYRGAGEMAFRCGAGVRVSLRGMAAPSARRSGHALRLQGVAR